MLRLVGLMELYAITLVLHKHVFNFTKCSILSVFILVFGLLLLSSFYSVVLSETNFKRWSLTSCSDVFIHRRL